MSAVRRGPIAAAIASFAIMAVCAVEGFAMQPFAPDDPVIVYRGRIDASDPARPRMHGSASYFAFRFRGTECAISVENEGRWGRSCFFAVEIDGRYQGRIRTTPGQGEYAIASGLEEGVHTVRVSKATEASSGYIDLLGIECDELLPPGAAMPPARTIEFIGDSITCGTGLATSEFPCEGAEWSDHHNGRLAFGPVLAESLDADWLLSSVSGAGVFRNWNTAGPTVPELYWKTALRADFEQEWTGGGASPELIVICLGTNDMSGGDGSYVREPLDGEEFAVAYVEFLKKLRALHPASEIVCATSPLLREARYETLCGYVEDAVARANDPAHRLGVRFFRLPELPASGCSGHPNEEEQRMIADELRPFVRELMGW